MNDSFARMTSRLASAALLLGAACAPAAANVFTSDPAQASAFAAFSQWLADGVKPVALPAIPRGVEVLRPRAPTTAQALDYEPAPVILAQPELPLAGPHPDRQGWSSGLNYQGLHAALLVLDASGKAHDQRPLAAGVRPGERFKLRLTATFPAVAELDQVAGETWYGRRLGQFYPRPGLSVQIDAGEVVDLPLDEPSYFALDKSFAGQRLLLSVRHAKALGSARSAQPVYRQDDARGSSCLQLVPAQRYPAMEQLISLAQ